ncbi:unnamed protein product [Moneuplotes crassus]|uniref:Uncharacterized protein n=1 Tax=Euplotes crassus TaxID=5936 RepID=A0AAD1XGZ7_EUPCR|nr:unnamed protein product [Moneuplotes crassus]
MATKDGPAPADIEWAQKNCAHVFQTYVTDKKTDKFDVASQIDAIFADISIQFDLDEYEELLNDAKKALTPEMFLSQKEFEDLLTQWILMFREEITSALLADSIDTVRLRLGTLQDEIKTVIRNSTGGASEEAKTSNIFGLFPSLMSTMGVRIVSLAKKQPKSDSSICNETEEMDFYNDLSNQANILNLETLNLKTLEELLMAYFNGIDAKYAFVQVNQYNEDSGLDPFKEMGEDNPFSKNQEGNNSNEEDMKIKETEQDIEEARLENNQDKVELLGKIKQYYTMKKSMTAQNEKEKLDLMIEGVRKEIDKLDGVSHNPDSDISKRYAEHPEESKDFKPDYNGAMIGEENKYEDMNDQNYNNLSLSYPEKKIIQPSPSPQLQDPYPQDGYPADNIPYGNNMDSYPPETNPYGQESIPYHQKQMADEAPKAKQNNSYNQTSAHQKQIEIEKRLEDPVEPLEDRRKKGIREIFDFYTRQHLMIGKKATFEEIQYELSNMNMGEFMKFCKDFKIPVSKTRCAEIFKKTAKNSKEMFIEHFKESFPKLISMRNKEKLEGLEKRLNEVVTLIDRRTRKLESNLNSKHHSKPQVTEENSLPKDNSRDEVPLNLETGPVKEESKLKKSKDKPFENHKSRGGDPHGALEKMHQKELQKVKDKMESQDTPNEASPRETSLANDAEEKDQFGEVQVPLPKDPPKMDPALVQQKVSQDREIQALNSEKERIENEIQNMSQISEDKEKMTEEAMQFLQLDDPTKYKKKIKGFAAPFNMTEKDDRIKKNDKSQRYKYTSKEDKEAIKAKVRKLKQERENAKLKEKHEKDRHYHKQRNVMKNLHEKLMREKLGNGEIDMNAYQARNPNPIYNVSQSQPALKSIPAQQVHTIKTHKSKIKNKLPNKITMNGLTSLKYEDIAGNEPDGFNPADIVGTDSGSDDSILQQYRNDEEIQPAEQAYPFSSAQHTEKPVPIDQVPVRKPKNQRNTHVARGLNNSMADASQLQHPKKASRKHMPGKKHSTSLNRGHTTDHEKSKKKKMGTQRSRKNLAALPKGLTKTGRKPQNPYNSDIGGGKIKYPAHVTRTVKKDSKKAPIGKLNHHSAYKANPMVGRRNPGNISMESYDQATKLQSKTKRNQEERLKNILKLQDNNMKRGVGVAYKNRHQL